MKYLIKRMKYLIKIMKYLIKIIGYLFLLFILLGYLIIERFVKSFSFMSKIIWNLNIKKEWFISFKTYDVIILIPFPFVWFIPLTFKANTLKDYLLRRNWNGNDDITKAIVDRFFKRNINLKKYE